MKRIIYSRFFWCLLGLQALVFFNTANAENNQPYVVDLYGAEKISAKDIQKKYAPELLEIASSVLSTPISDSFKNEKRMRVAREKILAGINENNRYAYIGFSAVMYPGYPGESEKLYVTIDVVEKKDKERRLLAFLPDPEGHFSDPYGLIKAWDDYEKQGLERLAKSKIAPSSEDCPVYHCIFGFDGELKKYQKMFDENVPKAKSDLIRILKEDNDSSHRATAAFLLAHTKDGNELIKLLVPSMRDASGTVRNNVMRVMAATLEKLKTADFPIEEVIAALDFPEESDRNKALYMLLSLVQQPRYASYVAEHAGNLLLENLQMQQPNLHGMAYDVLLRMSGKKFKERDYSAWKQWVNNSIKRK